MVKLYLAGNFIERTEFLGYGHLQLVIDDGAGPTQEIEVQSPLRQFADEAPNFAYPDIRDHYDLENTTGIDPTGPELATTENYTAIEIPESAFAGRNITDVVSTLFDLHIFFDDGSPNFSYTLGQNSNSYINTLLWMIGIDLRDYIAGANPETVTTSLGNGFPGSDRNVLLDGYAYSVPGIILDAVTPGFFPFNSTTPLIFPILHTGTDGADFLRTGRGDDEISLGSGDDTLFTGDGNDLIIAGEGSDLVDGEGDFDSVSYSESTTGIVAAFGEVLTQEDIDLIEGDLPSYAITVDELASRDILLNIEEVEGTDADDVFRLDFSGDDIFQDGPSYVVKAGDQTKADILDLSAIDFALGITWIEDVILVSLDDGSVSFNAFDFEGIEALIATAGDDNIEASDFDNWIDGSLGADELRGGLGSDTILFDADDLIVDGGGLPNDADWDEARFTGEGALDLRPLPGNQLNLSGFDMTVGGEEADYILGDASHVVGKGGNDTLFGKVQSGGAGNDTLFGGDDLGGAPPDGGLGDGPLGPGGGIDGPPLPEDSAPNPDILWGGSGNDTFYTNGGGILFVTMTDISDENLRYVTPELFNGFDLGIDLSFISTIIVNFEAGDILHVNGGPTDGGPFDVSERLMVEPLAGVPNGFGDEFPFGDYATYNSPESIINPGSFDTSSFVWNQEVSFGASGRVWDLQGNWRSLPEVSPDAPFEGPANLDPDLADITDINEYLGSWFLVGATVSGGVVQTDGSIGLEFSVSTEGDDTQNGNENKNAFKGSTGADFIDGKEGIDVVSYASSAAPIVINLFSGIAQGGDAEGDTLISIENLWGSVGDDALTGDGVANELSGREGADTLTGGEGDDAFIFRTGDGSDLITDFDVSADRISIDGVDFDPNGLGSGVSAAQTGDDVEISYGSGDVITLAGVSLSVWQNPGPQGLLIDGDSFELLAFGTQDAGSAVLSSTDGVANDTAALTNNAWKSIDLAQTITGDTVLRFEFSSDVEGEIHGIGFDTDDVQSEEWFFQLDGTQKWGLQNTANKYTTGSGFQGYEIRVGDFFTGDFSELVFVMDDDAGVGADSSFRNISFAEVPLNLVVDGVAQRVERYGQDQDHGSAVSSNTGGVADDTLTLSDNAWKKVVIDKTITPDTVLKFDFSSDVEGEIHGIGFDTDDAQSEEWFFQLDGSQNWGLQNAAGDYTTGSGFQSYEIRVGDHFTGDFANLVLVMDDDAGLGGDSSFRNIRFEEERLAVLVDGVSQRITSYGSDQDSGLAAPSNTHGAEEDTLTLTENAWKKAVINKTITADTVLRFEFKSDVEGEIHGIGFDTDDEPSEEFTFQLDGTQNWGLQVADGQYTTGSGYKAYEIRVGDHFQGSFDNLVFVMDDDANLGADSSFRNITFEEVPLV